MKRKVFAYIRVSTSKQAIHGYSLEAQEIHLRHYAEGHGLEIVELFIEDESAFTSGKRLEFKKMCVRLEESTDVAAILCYKQDRLQRNLTDYSLLVEGLGVSIISATEGEISDKENALMGGIRAVLAREESLKISERVTSGMKMKAAKGFWPSSAPVGYLNYTDKDENKRIMPDPNSAALVVKLFELYAHAGMSITDLRNWAREAGLKTRRGEGKPLARNGIHRILQDPIYYGDIRWDGITNSGKHEALISKALFDRVQARLHRKPKPKTKHHFHYRGLLFCGYCGCMLTAERHARESGKEYIYYRCSGSRGKCGQPRYREDVIADRLVEVINRIRISPEIVEILRGEQLATAKARGRARRAKILELKSDEQSLAEKQDMAYQDKLEGVLPENRWLRVDEQLAAQLADVREELSELNAEREPKWDDLRTTFERLEQGPELYRRSGHAFRAQQLSAVAFELVVTAENIEPNYKKPFGAVAKGLQESDWWSQGDLNPRRRDESPLS